MTYPAREARLKAGFDTAAASKRLRVGRPYLLRLEREGCFPCHLAERAARVYGCDEVTLLLPAPGRSGRRKRAKAGRAAGYRSPAAGAK